MKARLIAIASVICITVALLASLANQSTPTPEAAPRTPVKSERLGRTIRATTLATASPTSITSVSAASGATATTTRSGTRTVLVMMVNWTKPDATTPAAAQQQIGVTANAWYAKASGNRLGFKATATRWMTVPKADCAIETGGYVKVLAAAEKAAIANGYKPSAYDHEMVYFPFDAKCNYGGLGTVGGRASWVNGEMDARVTVHELGHNLGLNHARSAMCVDAAGKQVSVSSKCTIDEYGDTFDSMGVPTTGTPDFSAFQLNHLGWLAGHVTTVTTSKSVTLLPLGNGSGVLAARIVTKGGEYWVEYRRPVGVDSTLSASPGAVNGVLIHRIDPDGGVDLLDGRPDATKSFSNAAFPAASTMRAAGLSVKVTAVTGAKAVMSISIT